MLEADPKYQILFEFLIDNVTHSNILNQDEINQIQEQSLNLLTKNRVEAISGQTCAQIQSRMKLNDLSRALALDSDVANDIENLETEIDILQRQLELQEGQLLYVSQNTPNNISRNEASYGVNDAQKVDDESKNLLREAFESIDESTNQIAIQVKKVLDDYLEISGQQASQGKPDPYKKQLAIQSHPDKIIGSSLNETSSLVNEFISSITSLSQTIIESLKKLQEDDPEDENTQTENQEISSQLLKEVEDTQEQLFKVWRDNFHAKISFQRWKHTYEQVESLSKKRQRSESSNLDQNQAKNLLDQLKENTGDLVQQILIQHEEQIQLKSQLVQEDLKSQAHCSNQEEQGLLIHAKEVESHFSSTLNKVQLVQMLIELDQNETQGTFDKLQQAKTLTEQQKFLLDLRQSQFADTLKYVDEAQAAPKRATLDERDLLIVTINSLLNQQLQGSSVTDDKQLFVYKQDLINKVSQLSKKSQTAKADDDQKRKDSQLVSQLLQELFSQTYDKKKGDLVSDTCINDPAVDQLSQSLEQIGRNTEKIRAIVNQDRLGSQAQLSQGNTIQSEEFIVDLLCNESKRLKTLNR